MARRRYRPRPRVYVRRPAIRIGCGPIGCWIPLWLTVAAVVLVAFLA